VESNDVSTVEANEATEAAGDPSDGRDEFMSPDELGVVIDDLRSGRRPAILEGQEP
jgi:hypothetical protein